jgi:CheY-like chemotaxis protein
MACADIARRELGQQQNKLSTLVAEIILASERARDLVQQLLAFGRRQTLEPSPIALDQLLLEQSALLERLVGERVSVELSTGVGPAVVEADRAQLIQVLTNLATNASDAMPDGGTLRVHVEPERVNEGQGDLPSGDYVVLSVSDTGCGMDENTRELIFEPFFTTKEAGHNGLGLATVYGIVQQHGGAIRLRTSPGEGTEVRVYLCPSAALPKETPEQEIPSSSPRGYTGSALLVEDDDEVRRLVEMLLRRAGFRVLAAASGRQALALAHEHAEAVRLVVADIVMPGLTGFDLWAKLRDRWPEAKVLFVSGYSHGVIERVPTNARVAFLAKPFTAEEFERKIGTLIEASPSELGAHG